MITKPVVYTPAEAADLLKINVQTLYRYVREGRICAARLGRVYRIRDCDLREFLGRSTPQVRKAKCEKKT